MFKFFFYPILKTMPFYEIQDLNKRDEIVKEINERRKKNIKTVKMKIFMMLIFRLI